MIIKLKYERRDSFVNVRIFMGSERLHLNHCGSLTLTSTEFEALRQLLKDGVMLMKGAEYVESDATDGGSSGTLPKIDFPKKED